MLSELFPASRRPEELFATVAPLKVLFAAVPRMIMPKSVLFWKKLFSITFKDELVLMIRPSTLFKNVLLITVLLTVALKVVPITLRLIVLLEMLIVLPENTKKPMPLALLAVVLVMLLSCTLSNRMLFVKFSMKQSWIVRPDLPVASIPIPVLLPPMLNPEQLKKRLFALILMQVPFAKRFEPKEVLELTLVHALIML